MIVLICKSDSKRFWEFSIRKSRTRADVFFFFNLFFFSPEAPSGHEGSSSWRGRQWCYVGASQKLGSEASVRPDGVRDVTGAPTRDTRVLWKNGRRWNDGRHHRQFRNLRATCHARALSRAGWAKGLTMSPPPLWCIFHLKPHDSSRRPQYEKMFWQ